MSDASKDPMSTDAVRADFRSYEERAAAGRALRDRLPRDHYASWRRPRQKRDPVDLLERSNAGRVSALVPFRAGRMLRSPFAFLRGSAGLMAHDLAQLPSTGLRVQACGDCHVMNFGLFATPERALVFDLNDFDETLPAPWEWDVQRLAVSAAVSARESGLPGHSARDAAATCVRSYREHLRAYAQASPLEVWYTRLDVDELVELAPTSGARAMRKKLARTARGRVAEALFPKIATSVAGQTRLVDEEPLLFHVPAADAEARVREGLLAYRGSLPDERRVLFDRYQLVDFAAKVVGIGSVGTRCHVGLFLSNDGHPLILQFKEASRSILEPYAGKSAHDNAGERVVVGQRLMQSSSDIFLGWAKARGRDFYVRQLRDMKLTVPIELASASQLVRHSEICGWSLARAHAKAGDAATIGGYLGKSDRFDTAIAAFALAYADQTERDHAALHKAVRAGRIAAVLDETKTIPSGVGSAARVALGWI